MVKDDDLIAGYAGACGEKSVEYRGRYSNFEPGSFLKLDSHLNLKFWSIQHMY
jgi:hypothetical protein